MTRDADSPRLGLPAALIAAAIALPIAMGAAGLASWLEAASFVTGAVCVWLTVRENIWNFPLGLANVATYSVVFFQARLFADAGLQVVYFILGVIGWTMWLRGGERRTALRIHRAGRLELAATALFAVGSTVILWRTLRLVGGSSSFLDALTTSLSLASQWLLNRKKVETWIGWIVVDIIYVPLYLSKGLHLTAVLYAVFLGMATLGLREWRRRLAESEAAPPAAGAAPMRESAP
ncbi:MAG: nicotinamide riboside transporter PnuC [Kofleriaceae bacterium]